MVDQDGKPQSQYHSGTFNETEDGVPVIGENGMHFGTKLQLRKESAEGCG